LGAYLVGGVLDVLGLAILLLGTNVWVSAAGLWIAVIGVGIWSTVLSSVLTKVSPEDKVGYMLGLSNGSSMIGRVCGPMIAGSFFLEINLNLPFVISLILVLVVVANAARLLVIQRRVAST
jgi:MFS family permease